MVVPGHHSPVHVLPVATTRAVRSRRTSYHGAHGSRQRSHCTEDAEAAGNQTIPRMIT